MQKRGAGTRQTVGYADKQRKAFGNQTSTLARSADRLLRIQASCQEGAYAALRRSALLCRVVLCFYTDSRREARGGAKDRHGSD